MNNDLSTEDQRLLTEFLGECWHEHATLNTLIWERVVHNCDKCKERMNPSDLPRLDFSDWRVIGRLVEQTWTHRPLGDTITLSENLSKAILHRHSKLAICRAVLAYLKEKE